MSGFVRNDMTSTQDLRSQNGLMSPTWSVSCRQHCADMSLSLSFWRKKSPTRRRHYQPIIGHWLWMMLWGRSPARERIQHRRRRGQRMCPCLGTTTTTRTAGTTWCTRACSAPRVPLFGNNDNNTNNGDYTYASLFCTKAIELYPEFFVMSTEMMTYDVARSRDVVTSHCAHNVQSVKKNPSRWNFAFSPTMISCWNWSCCVLPPLVLFKVDSPVQTIRFAAELDNMILAHLKTSGVVHSKYVGQKLIKCHILQVFVHQWWPIFIFLWSIQVNY